MKVKHFLVGLVMMLCVVMLGSSDASAAGGRTLELDGKTVKGTTKQSVTYTMSPTCSGTVKVKVFYASAYPVTAVLKNTSTSLEKTITSTVIDGKSTIEFTYCAEKGKYDLTLDFYNGSKDIKYGVVAKFTERNSTNNGGGQSLAKPAAMTHIDQKNGVVGFDEGMDCYKITLNAEEDLKLKLTNHSTESMLITVYDTYKNILQSEPVAMEQGPRVYDFDEANGIYYVTIENNDKLGFGIDYTITTGDYIAITDLKLSKTKLTVNVGDVKTLKTTITPSNATEGYAYKSSNSKVVKVYSSGKIKALKAGTATIAVYSKNGKVIARCKVTVKSAPTPTPTPTKAVTASPTKAPVATATPTPTKAPTANVAVTSISVNSNVEIVKVGGTKTITYTISPSNATDKSVTFTSIDSSIATVSSKGVITGVKAGRTNISVKSSNGKTIFITVTVS